ncbi:MAG: dihydroneopterin aldolase [Paracoccaceae bacterium]
MTSDISHAFDHPEARAAATQEAGHEAPRDRISLRDHIVEVEIGAFQAERGVRQRICFNIVVEVRAGKGPVADDVDRILSYDRITEAIRLELEAERLNLLETLAERIAERILNEPRAMRVFVRIEKLDRGPGALGVEIVRTAVAAGEAAGENEAPIVPPLIVCLSAEAIGSPYLSGWIDQLEARSQPLIFCVGLGQGARPASGAPAAQRRIDLLAIEQQAWVLAGHDPRCVVVETGTEIDWAMKNGQTIVWAPSKMVLDRSGAPDVRDTAALAGWFAAQFEAADVLLIGVETAGGAAPGVLVFDGRNAKLPNV